ncbi:ABC transporter ATP-binding protein [Pseudoclavibacter sp. RFBA6]|uniref:ABC transporter ATP-binding protein n=1 Tax=Pseudoclavibacter sp. RFBA6 TaxID=2080573 RepID=UPI002158956F|nr:ABC transporter ATP-binding protein [Pseudoclavibacter sp. RFBA6]
MASVTLDSVSVRFPSGTVGLDSVDLAVRDGEFLALVGPSGSGKTTLLRTIAGFQAPSSGRVSIGERVVAGGGSVVPPEARELGMVFQQHAVWPHWNVGRNVDYPLRRARVAKPERRRRVDEALEMVGLAGSAKRNPATLSGGQRQRVAIARALIGRPRVLLLDEALSALDEPLRDSLRLELHTLTRELGLTVVHVTHDRSEALALADRVAVLDGGRIQQLGTPEELVTRPASPFIAKFLSDATIVDGTIVGAVDGAVDGAIVGAVDVAVGGAIGVAVGGAVGGVVDTAGFAADAHPLRVDWARLEGCQPGSLGAVQAAILPSDVEVEIVGGAGTGAEGADSSDVPDRSAHAVAAGDVLREGVIRQAGEAGRASEANTAGDATVRSALFTPEGSDLVLDWAGLRLRARTRGVRPRVGDSVTVRVARARIYAAGPGVDPGADVSAMAGASAGAGVSADVGAEVGAPAAAVSGSGVRASAAGADASIPSATRSEATGATAGSTPADAPELAVGASNSSGSAA